MRRLGHGLAVLVQGLGAALLGAQTASAADDATDLQVSVTIPDTGGPVAVTGALLRWGLNHEAASGAYFGGCNFLSAGTAGDTGSARLWTEADGFYATEAGNVSVEKPDATGAYVAPTWATRCQGPDGAAVTTSSPTGTGTEVVVEGGTGVVDRSAGTATIRWSGSFTVVFYGGMTYWSASDPVLTVAADGTGTLTATASGFGT